VPTLGFSQLGLSDLCDFDTIVAMFGVAHFLQSSHLFLHVSLEGSVPLVQTNAKLTRHGVMNFCCNEYHYNFARKTLPSCLTETN